MLTLLLLLLMCIKYIVLVEKKTLAQNNFISLVFSLVLSFQT